MKIRENLKDIHRGGVCLRATHRQAGIAEIKD